MKISQTKTARHKLDPQQQQNSVVAVSSFLAYKSSVLPTTFLVAMNIVTTAALVCLLSLSLSSTSRVVSFQPIRAIVRHSRWDATTTTTTGTTTPTTKTTHATMAIRTTRLWAVSESGIETGVIKGIQEDSAEIDFGRCGVKLAEETAVRMSGIVNKNNNGPTTAAAATAEWKSLDNILKLSPIVLDETGGTNSFKSLPQHRQSNNTRILVKEQSRKSCTLLMNVPRPF